MGWEGLVSDGMLIPEKFIQAAMNQKAVSRFLAFP
jgi:hypothetical protein